VLLKYNSSGTLLWAKTHNGTLNIADCIFDLKFDHSGNIVATGAEDDFYNFDSSSVLLHKYSPDGNLLWSQVYHTINPGGELGKKLLIDNNDNIFIMGQTQQYQFNNFTCTFLLKYNSLGTLQWSKRHGDYFNSKSFPFNISFDNSQNIFISGYEKKYGRTNLMLLKYNNLDGAQIWNYLYNNNGNSSDIALYAGYNSGNLFISGSTNNNFLLMKMQPTNSYTYTFRRDNINKPVLDSQYTYDTVLLSTDQLPPEAYIRYINIKIDTLLHSAMGDIEITLKNGSIEDTLFFRRGGPLDNMIGTNLNDTSAIDICNNGLPPFTGFFAPCKTLSKHLFRPGSGPWILKIYDRKAPETGYLKSWALTLSYEIPIGINPTSTEIPKEFSLYQNYPNPFNPVTKIKYSIPESSQAKLIIYDVNGKEIYTVVNEWLNAGIYESEFNASELSSGIYFYQLITNNFTETKKMVLIK
jgi:subtilisin-like proprotein convertase family protein